MKLTPELKATIDKYFEDADPQELYDKYCKIVQDMKGIDELTDIEYSPAKGKTGV